MRDQHEPMKPADETATILAVAALLVDYLGARRLAIAQALMVGQWCMAVGGAARLLLRTLRH